MVITAKVKVIEEVGADWETHGWRLWFQWCEYSYSDGTSQHGYRFIWRRLNKKLQAGRGQARLPSIADVEALLQKAKAEGWGHHTDGEESTRVPVGLRRLEKVGEERRALAGLTGTAAL